MDLKINILKSGSAETEWSGQASAGAASPELDALAERLFAPMKAMAKSSADARQSSLDAMDDEKMKRTLLQR